MKIEALLPALFFLFRYILNEEQDLALMATNCSTGNSTDGTIRRIVVIDKKVVAAVKKGRLYSLHRRWYKSSCLKKQYPSIQSTIQEALKKLLKKIGHDMKIIPVKQFPRCYDI